MTSNSNFLTNFNDPSIAHIDILTTVSSQVFANYVKSNSTSGILMPCRYLYLGDMLIQFSDFSNYDNSNNFITDGGNSVTITFPIPYNSPPYIALLAPYISTSSGSMLNIKSLTSTSLTCYVANNGSTPAFFTVGPRYIPPLFTFSNINTSIMSATYSYSNNYYVITIINIKSPDTSADSVLGNITFNEPILNASVICVGAGGGGAGSVYGEYNSGGGGGGGNCLINNVNFNSSMYSFYIGTGGAGGDTYAGYNGGSTYLTDSSNNILIKCSGGAKGSTSAGGSGGSITVGGSGGSGGNGGGNNSNGTNSASYNTPFILPTEVSNIPISYCGGGGGAINNGGGCGNNGLGGVAGNNINFNGQDAISYGSGGGAASGSLTYTNGGNGANGVMYIFFQYPLN